MIAMTVPIRKWCQLWIFI